MVAAAVAATATAAARRADVTGVRELIRAYPRALLRCDGSGDTPLHLAARHGGASARHVTAALEAAPAPVAALALRRSAADGATPLGWPNA